MNAISIDLRKRVVKAYRNGEGSYRTLAKRFDISPGAVLRFVKLDQAGKDLDPGKSPGPPPKIPEDHLPFIKQIYLEQNDLTYVEYSDLYYDEYSVQVSHTALKNALDRLGFTRKKNK